MKITVEFDIPDAVFAAGKAAAKTDHGGFDATDVESWQDLAAFGFACVGDKLDISARIVE